MWNGTNSLVFHACEDDIEHLCERGLSSGLVDEIAAGQVDVVAGPDCQEHRALMNLDVRRGHSRQQGLDRDKRKVMSYPSCCCSPCWITTPHTEAQTFRSLFLVQDWTVFCCCFFYCYSAGEFQIKENNWKNYHTTHWSACYLLFKLVEVHMHNNDTEVSFRGKTVKPLIRPINLMSTVIKLCFL